MIKKKRAIRNIINKERAIRNMIKKEPRIKIPKEFKILAWLMKTSYDTNIVLDKVYIPYPLFMDMVNNKSKLEKLNRDWWKLKQIPFMAISPCKDIPSFRLWRVNVYPHPETENIIAFYADIGIRVYNYRREDNKLEWTFTTGYVNHYNRDLVDFGFLGESEERDKMAQKSLKSFTPPHEVFYD